MPLDKARHWGIYTQSMVDTSTLCTKVSEKMNIYAGNRLHGVVCNMYEMVSKVLLNGHKVHDIKYKHKEKGECCGK